ncbi:MAG TPA: carboxypeptidase-like regulatory domain-containing protein, partial [Kofleriaceae bacterium]|nr:carboxypeptidase-like regulatory domain-containing protein [Kofleriaceae bacterium]
MLRGGEPQAAASVVATSLTTGAVVKAASRANGAYELPGLPPGQYLIAVKLASGEETVDYVDVGTGQTLQLDLDAAKTAVRGAERIEVSGRRAELRTSEVATDVGREQIENLPQNNRNFLNFAQLAPGVRVSDDEFNKNVSSGGLAARQTNVFVDGVSLKNNIIEGGVVGQ